MLPGRGDADAPPSRRGPSAGLMSKRGVAARGGGGLVSATGWRLAKLEQRNHGMQHGEEAHIPALDHVAVVTARWGCFPRTPGRDLGGHAALGRTGVCCCCRPRDGTSGQGSSITGAPGRIRRPGQARPGKVRPCGPLLRQRNQLQNLFPAQEQGAGGSAPSAASTRRSCPHAYCPSMPSPPQSRPAAECPHPHRAG